MADTSSVGISRWWLTVRIVAVAIFFISLNFCPQWLGYFFFGSQVVSVKTPADLGVELPTTLLNLWLVLTLVTSIVLLGGRSTRGLRWLELGTGVLAAWIFFAILLETIAAFATGIQIAELSDPFVRQMLAWIIQGALAAGLVWTVVVSIQRFLQLTKRPVSSPAAEDGDWTTKGTGGRWGDFKNTLRQDFADIYDFYLDDTERSRLAAMSTVAKTCFVPLWLLKSLFLRLTPTRRILLVVAVLVPSANFNFGVYTFSFDLQGAGFLILLLILLLELKDKLLAHDELAAGKAIQTALLPKEQPTISGWDIWLYTQPAKEVGGDLVDYVELGGNRFAVALGDVAGKGLGAALLMVKIQATLRALAPRFDSLAELGAELNAILYRDGVRNRFASLFYLELKPDSSELRTMNAGHLPPVVVAEDGTESKSRGAPALGLMPNTTYKEERFALAPGDLLLIYSDGVTEAMNGAGDFFGDERLLNLAPRLRELSAAEAGERVLAEVAAFVRDERPSDDLSLAILKRRR